MAGTIPTAAGGPSRNQARQAEDNHLTSHARRHRQSRAAQPERVEAAKTRYQKEHLALRAQRSLYIRLLVYRPLRNRNLREMKINENLYHDGKEWIIEFQGIELKVGRRNGSTNVYRLSWPAELVSQLEEFLKALASTVAGE